MLTSIIINQKKVFYIVSIFVLMLFMVFSPAVSNDVEAQSVTYKCSLPALTGIERCFTATTDAEAKKNCEDKCIGSGGGIPIRGNCAIPSSAADCSNIGPTDPISASVEAVSSYAFDKLVEYVIEGLLAIIHFINAILVYVIGIVAGLFDQAVGIALAGFGQLQFIELGWKIVRDVANIFFILILLIIAIATILRVETYGIKQLLPRLIITALLINFSLVIALTVVDAANILALQFIEPIHPVSNSIANIMNISHITAVNDGTNLVGRTEIDFSAAVSNGFYGAIDAFNNSPVADPREASASAFGQTSNTLDHLLMQGVFEVFILILQLILVFVFVALGALLIIRTVALTIIFVFAPIGFVAGILPQTKTYADDWWKALFNWAFFFPASAFMMYLAIQYGTELSKVVKANQVLNTAALFSYVSIAAILLGSILVAKKMGIYGAEAAIRLGKDAKSKAQGYVGAKAGKARTGIQTGIKNAGLVGAGGAAQFLASRASNIPIVSGFLTKAPNRIIQADEKRKNEKEKQYQEIAKGSKTAIRAALQATVLSQNSALLRRSAIEAGKADAVESADLIEDHAKYVTEGNTKAYQNIEKVLPHLAGTRGANASEKELNLQQAISKLTAKDVQDNLREESLSHTQVQDALLAVGKSNILEAGLDEFGKKFGDALQDAYLRLRAANSNDPLLTYDKINRASAKFFAVSPGAKLLTPTISREVTSSAATRGHTFNP